MSKTSRINIGLYGNYNDSLLPVDIRHYDINNPTLKIDKSHLNEGFENIKKWGPSLWFTLHNSSYNYPEKANILCAERTKNFILGIPQLIPVLEYKKDIEIFIAGRNNELLEICKSRERLFNFFVDMHNMVNKKLKKKIFSYEEAKKLYS